MAEPEPSPSGPNPRPVGFTSELSARVASAIVLAALAVLITWQGGPLFALLWFCAGSVMAVEWFAMAGLGRLRTLSVVAILGLAALSLAMHLLTPEGAAVVGCVAGLVLSWLAAGTRDRLWALAGLLYASVMVLAMPLLRDEAPYGLTILLWMFAVVWASDIAGYFAGRRFGGPKLWPAVSPKKTWSGALAGLLAGVIAGLAVVLAARRAGVNGTVDLPLVAFGSAIASVAGQFGDLAESALKRHHGVKDSGRIIPGHGGVMDRLDALWAVALLSACGLMGFRLVQH